MNVVDKLLDNVVQVQIDNETGCCLGAIIAPQLIITAALCATYGTSVILNESKFAILKKYILKEHLGVFSIPANNHSGYTKLSNLDDIYLYGREGVVPIIENETTVLQTVLLRKCEKDSYYESLYSICGSLPCKYERKKCTDSYGSPLFVNDRIVGIASTSQCYKYLRTFYTLASVQITIRELADSIATEVPPVIKPIQRSLDLISTIISTVQSDPGPVYVNNRSATTSSLKGIRLKIKSRALSKSTLIIYLEKIKVNMTDSIVSKQVTFKTELSRRTSTTTQTVSEATVAAKSTNIMEWFNRVIKNKQYKNNGQVVIFPSTTPSTNVGKTFEDFT